jgi:hypothetical protein
MTYLSIYKHYYLSLQGTIHFINNFFILKNSEKKLFFESQKSNSERKRKVFIEKILNDYLRKIKIFFDQSYIFY